MGDASGASAFEWWVPHDRALRRARALFGFGAVVTALYVVTPFAVVVALIGDGSRRVVEVAVVAVVVVIAVAIAIAVVAWRGVPRAVLRLARTRAPTREEARTASIGLDGVALARGLALPTVWVVDDDAPNAFVIGRPGRAHVGFTSGALRLPADELEALCAFELSALTSRTFSLCTAAIDIVLVAEMCTRALWTLGVFAFASALVGVPGEVIAVVLLSLTVLVAVTRLALLVADRALPRLLDDADGLVDLEAIGCTGQPQAYARLLRRVRVDGNRVATSWTIAHLWFDRDEDETETDLPAPRAGPVRGLFRAVFLVPMQIDAPVLARRCERPDPASGARRETRVGHLANRSV